MPTGTMPQGQLAGSAAQQRVQQWALIQALQAAGASFFNDRGIAETTARARGWTVVGVPGVTGMSDYERKAWPGADQPRFAAVDPKKYAGGGGAQSGGGSGGTGAGGGALAATQAGAAYTGGGQYFETGAVQNQAAGVSERDDEFLGLDTLTPDERLAPGRTPKSINWDDIRKLGSRCVRSGTAKLTDDRDNVGADYFNIVCVANSAFTASTEYITFTKPDSTTHAYWFDTTGSDTEPAGSQAATNSTEVTTTGMTAAQVATALAAAINTDDIGLVAIAASTAVRVFNKYGLLGTTWTLAETVTDAGFTVTPVTPTSLDSTMRGLGIAYMPGSGSNTNRLILTFADGAVGGTATAWPTTLILADSSLRWGRPLPLNGLPGPLLALTDQGSQVLRVTSAYTNVFSTANDGLRNISVKRLVVRYSTVGYPLDKDGNDNTSSTALVNGTWAGASRNDDSGTLTAVRIYVSAWAVGIEGVSERSEASKTLA
ncbi:MAG: hypothetical protein IPP14_15690 [Planctomycetes bacterium]|nr:hypothetical protein [Planctomycetota bacterium]